VKKRIRTPSLKSIESISQLLSRKELQTSIRRPKVKPIIESIVFHSKINSTNNNNNNNKNNTNNKNNINDNNNNSNNINNENKRKRIKKIHKIHKSLVLKELKTVETQVNESDISNATTNYNDNYNKHIEEVLKFHKDYSLRMIAINREIDKTRNSIKLILNQIELSLASGHSKRIVSAKLNNLCYFCFAFANPNFSDRSHSFCSLSCRQLYNNTSAQ